MTIPNVANYLPHQLPTMPPALLHVAVVALQWLAALLGLAVLFGFVALVRACRRPLKPLPFGTLTGDVLFLGPRGSGKSYLAWRLCLEDEDSHVATNATVDVARLAAIAERRGEPPKTVVTVRGPGEFLDRHCAMRWLDEAPQYFPARGYKDIDPVAVKAIFEQRKDDGRTVYTAQALRHLDVQPASFCDYVVRVKPMRRAPFIGWPFMRPDCVRPTVMCRWSYEEREEPHVRRDGRGDQTTLLEKLLGFGSYCEWEVVDPELIVKGRTVNGSADPEDDPAVLSRGRAFFSLEIANCYDSGQKVDVHLDANPKKNRRGAGAPPGAQPPAGGAPAAALPAPLPF